MPPALAATPTLTTSARPSHLRAIQTDMTAPTTPRRRGPRPDSQAAQLAVRMSREERASITAAAAAAGLTVPAYLLGLHAAARRADAAASPAADSLRNAEEPGPNRDRTPHAKAGRAIAVAAG